MKTLHDFRRAVLEICKEEKAKAFSDSLPGDLTAQEISERINAIEIEEALPRCANCAFWREILGGAGRCRKRAPHGLPYPVSKRHHDGVVLEWGIAAHWPATNAADFCGEFERRD